MYELTSYLVLILAGFIAGIINTIAGGGSFLTLPTLMLFGFDPKVANATNRVAVLCSSGSAVATFYRHSGMDKTFAWRLTWPTLLGVPIGVLMAVYLPADAFKSVFGLIFLAMAGLLIFNPKRIAEKNQDAERQGNSTYIGAVFFLIGIYVGFIQAGTGILMLLAMSFLSDKDLMSANVVKNWIAFVVTLAAVVVFSYHGLIQWLPGLVMAVGNVLGGIVGAKLAIKKGNRLIFVFLIVVMVATGIKLLVR